MTIVKTHVPTFNLKGKGTVIVSPLLAAQIIALRKQCGRTEWSGMLFFKPINEELTNPQNFKATAEAVFPMDFGDATYTEYDFDAAEVVEMYERYPQAEPPKAKWKMGHIHSHHSMNAYFSGTDDQELKDNVDKYEYYLSLIVSDDGRYAAKVAFLANTQRKVQVKRQGKWSTTLGEPEQVMATFECNVEMGLELWFMERIDAVEKASRTRRVPRVNTYSYSTGYGSGYNPGMGYGGGTNRQEQIGFKQNQSVGSKLTSDNTPKVNTTINSPTPLEGQAVRVKIKESLPYLLFKDEGMAKNTKIYYAATQLKDLYPQEDQKQGYVGWLLGRFNGWLQEHFKEELKRYDKYWLANEVIEVLILFGSESHLFSMIEDKLSKKIDKDYKETKEEASKNDDVTESAHDAYLRELESYYDRD